jgi:hypothetical protein
MPRLLTKKNGYVKTAYIMNGWGGKRRVYTKNGELFTEFKGHIINVTDHKILMTIAKED